MSDDDLKTRLIAERNGESKVFARLEWEELSIDDWKIAAERLSAEEETKEMARHAPPGKRAP